MLTSIDQRDPEGLRDALAIITVPAAPVDGDALERALSGVLSNRVSDGLDGAAITTLVAILREFRLLVDPVVAGALRAVVTLDGTLRTLSQDFDTITAARLHTQGLIMGPTCREPRRTSLHWCSLTVGMRIRQVVGGQARRAVRLRAR